MLQQFTILNCMQGHPRGRGQSRSDEPPPQGLELIVEQVRAVNIHYDDGGAYWGNINGGPKSLPLFVARCGDTWMRVLRAGNRKLAYEKLMLPPPTDLSTSDILYYMLRRFADNENERLIKANLFDEDGMTDKVLPEALDYGSVKWESENKLSIAIRSFINTMRGHQYPWTFLLATPEKRIANMLYDYIVNGKAFRIPGCDSDVSAEIERSDFPKYVDWR